MKSLYLYMVLVSIFSIASSKLVREVLTLTWEEGAPDGQARDMVKMNGQFPGPQFYWDEGDDIEILVHNAMPFNSSIHWHGIEQHGTPWSDGATGVTQVPIELGESFIYRFKAIPSGTHWYHAHTRTTVLDGLYGAIFIRPKKNTSGPWQMISNDPSDIDAIEKAVQKPKLIVVSDWTKFKSWDYMEAQQASNLNIFCVDSILINGKGSVYCPGEDYLIKHTMETIKWAIYPHEVTDKGCLPFVKKTQTSMEYLMAARPENVPLNLNKGCVPADGGHEVIEVDPSAGWVGLSFIGAVSLKAVTFTIDEHPMWIYEVDGHYIEPQKVDLARQYTGERYAVLLKLDQPFRDYTIRVADDGIGQVISSFATLRYKDRKPDLRESQGVIDYGGQNITPVTWLDRDHLHPYPRLDFALQSDNLFVFRIYRWDNLGYHHTLSGAGKWDEDTTAYDPLLHNPYSETARDKNLVFRTKNDTWNDLVIQVGAFPDLPRDAPHTIHKHTTKMWQIGTALGIWNYSSTEEAIQAQPEAFEFDNPNYRDTFVTGFNNGPSWILLRYHATNPGPWMLHCHIETHLAGGMGVTILDGIDAWPNVPAEYANGRNGITDEQRVDWNRWKLAAESGEIYESTVDDTSFGDPANAIQGNNSWKGFANKLIEFLHTWSPQRIV